MRALLKNWLEGRKSRRRRARARRIERALRSCSGDTDLASIAVQTMLTQSPQSLVAALTHHMQLKDPSALDLGNAIVDAIVSTRRDQVLSALESNLDRDGHSGAPIGESIVAAAVALRRQSVMERLALSDPAYAERALSFSQEGEDLILTRMLEGRAPGFFVDIGAHHPYRFSNTYLLYRAGWRGINIDATPGSMRLFAEFRPQDINIEAFVGDPAEDRTLALYNEPALNSGSCNLIEQRALPEDRYWRVGQVDLHPTRLADLLAANLPPATNITFFNIDVEGSEQEVLESNDWARYRPEIILLEQVDTDLTDSLKHPTTAYLEELGYRIVAKAFNTTFFRQPHE